jgi:phosphopantothenoylcysteine decarboxylase/phosphopantothenate--cysteine ligase
MAEAVFRYFEDSHVLVMAAAVSDFTPATLASEKIKKDTMEPAIPLERTTDILATLKGRKTDQFLVGFAAESEDVRENALGKLHDKGLDLIVANDISREDSGFACEFNEAILLDSSGEEEALPRLPKAELAKILWDKIERARNVLRTSKIKARTRERSAETLARGQGAEGRGS